MFGGRFNHSVAAMAVLYRARNNYGTCEALEKTPLRAFAIQFVSNQAELTKSKIDISAFRDARGQVMRIQGDTIEVAVDDAFDNRIVFYNLPVSTNQAATYVLGQGGFTTSTASTPPTATSVRTAKGMIFEGSQYLWTIDPNNHRANLVQLPY